MLAGGVVLAVSFRHGVLVLFWFRAPGQGRKLLRSARIAVAVEQLIYGAESRRLSFGARSEHSPQSTLQATLNAYSALGGCTASTPKLLGRNSFCSRDLSDCCRQLCLDCYFELCRTVEDTQLVMFSEDQKG